VGSRSIAGPWLLPPERESRTRALGEEYIVDPNDGPRGGAMKRDGTEDRRRRRSCRGEGGSPER